MRFVVVTLTLIVNLAAADQPFKAPYLRVFDDRLHAAMVTQHEQALIAFKQAATAVGYRDHFHFFRMDDGTYPAFNPQKTAHGSADSDAAWAEISEKLDPKLLAEGSEVFGASIESQDLYTLSRRAAYSYPAVGVAPDDFLVMDILALKNTHLETAAATLMHQAALAKKQRVPQQYVVYSKLSGANLPILIRFTFAKNRADYETRRNRTQTLLGEEGRKLEQALAECIRGQTRRTGWYRRAASY
ncbi:hypothetical protein [Acanthopleuribacter pedis]|uniref:Uncharacterized protein n=1 Tax=Acanthopleuribacter pedis TaxID=442870 RepID=A0A8J7U1S1_9BACT|nr:hypothetical protein [Acanthopleuribacter pedis]MBO1318498.1 hypothetical protein [Acanthopleuribacter pedis]